MAKTPEKKLLDFVNAPPMTTERAMQILAERLTPQQRREWLKEYEEEAAWDNPSDFLEACLAHGYRTVAQRKNPEVLRDLAETWEGNPESMLVCEINVALGVSEGEE